MAEGRDGEVASAHEHGCEAQGLGVVAVEFVVLHGREARGAHVGYRGEGAEAAPPLGGEEGVGTVVGHHGYHVAGNAEGRFDVAVFGCVS